MNNTKIERVALVFLLIGCSFSVSSQFKIGPSIGYLLLDRMQSPTITTSTNDIRVYSTKSARGFTYIGVASELLYKGMRLKQELYGHRSLQSYHLTIPVDNPNSNFGFFSPTTRKSFVSLSYRGLIGINRYGKINVFIGPSVELDIPLHKFTTPYYADDYPEGAELERILFDSYKFATFYIDAEIGYTFKKKFDLAISYKKSITSKTKEFEYYGTVHRVISSAWMLYLRMTYYFPFQSKSKSLNEL